MGRYIRRQKRNTRRRWGLKLASPSRVRIDRRQAQFETLEPRRVLAADPIIAEFQAINATTIQDEDGSYSDWIEIRNPDSTPLDLGGWFLTDDAADLRKWQFPSVTLDGGEQLLVFASGKDRAAAGAELHTNFRLSGSGDYLGLVKPDGVTVAQDFGSEYPAQVEDQSYGQAVDRLTDPLVSVSSPAKVLVPTDDSLGTEWTQLGFDDSAWTSGNLGVGFEVLKPGFTEGVDFMVGFGPEWTVDVPEGSGAQVQTLFGTLSVSVPENHGTSLQDRGLAPIMSRDLPEDDPADWEMVTQILQSNSTGNPGLVVMDGKTGQPALIFEYDARARFQLRHDDEVFDSVRSSRRNSYFLRLARDGIENTWSAYFKLQESDDWTLVATVTDGDENVPIIADPRPGLIATTEAGQSVSMNVLNLDLVILDQPAVYGPRTGLDVGSQMSGVNTSIYVRVPFTVEGDPSRFDELRLPVQYDDGFRAYINGQEVTSQFVPIDATWDSPAAGTHGAVGGRIPVQSINISDAISTLQTGENVLAIHGMNVDLDDPDFFFTTDLLASELLGLADRVFVEPTPGKPNLLPAAPAPRIVGSDGVFFGSTTVELTVDTHSPVGLEIHYTLDGTEPTLESPVYERPISLTESAMFEARTFDVSAKPNFEPSNTTPATFIALDEELRDRDSDIPIILLDTLGQRLPATSSTTLAAMNVIVLDVSDATGRADLDEGIVGYIGRGGARDRGSSTAGQAKPNMAFETWGPGGTTQDDDANVPFLGMSPESDWVLHAPFSFDRALIRNQVAFEISNQMGIWASDYRHAEVYLNRGDGVVDETDYMGVYAVLEKIKQGTDRVDIAELTPQDNTEPNISGGYMWKVDRSDPSEPGFSGGGQALQWVYPKSPRSSSARDDLKATQDQQDWVVQYLNDFAATLRDPDINDPEGYSQYIDPVNWVDSHILNVWMMNVDALRLSGYYTKDRDGRVMLGPAWDFDRSAESNDGRDDNPNVWRSETGDLGTDFFGNGTQRWWGDLFNDPGFWQLYIDRWDYWRQTVLSDQNVDSVIDGMADELRESADRNFDARVNRSNRPRSNSGYENNVLDGTYQGEINNLKTWLAERARFFDSNFAPNPEYSIDGELLPRVYGMPVSAGQEVEIAPPGVQYFDDLTLVSGEPGATTASYYIPNILEQMPGDAWTATDFDDSSWQRGPLGFGFESRDDFADLIKTEVDPSVFSSTTFLARVPFEITDLTALSGRDLVLRMKYNDGFVASINGVEVLRQNLRDENDELNYATRARTNTEREWLSFEDFDLSEFEDLLVEGQNTLAIRAINSSSGNSNMLLLPELVAREVKFGRNPVAELYYTTDGTDPRAPDGQPSSTARLMKEGDRLTVDANMRVIARNLDPTYRGEESEIVRTNWSAPVEYNFVVERVPVVISEINYNPVGPTTTEDAAMTGLADEDFEFIEILNTGSSPASLIGIELTDGVTFDFADGEITTLDPGARALVVANQAAFELRYGAGLPIAGEFVGSLNNNGEDIDLIDGTGILFTVNYGDNDPWPVRADGLGASLVLRNPSATTAATQSKHYSWQGSTDFGGSPGSAGSGPLGVVINEVLAHTDTATELTDSIELLNTTDTPIDIGGWYLSDSSPDFLKYQIPAGTVLAPGQYAVFNESQFNADDLGDRGFALSGDQGDSVWLTVPNGAGGISAFADDVHFRATPDGESLARYPNGTGDLLPARQNTFGSENGQPRVGPIVISEINYNPGPPSEAALAMDAALTDNDLEFVEIHNPTASAVDLTNWRLRGGVDFGFDAATTLGANESAVVVKFNPDSPENVNRLAAFKAHYGIGDDVRILGGYQGRLNNSDDTVLLLHPDQPPVDQPNFVPHYLEDAVVYDDLAPWPMPADGTGASLTRAALDGAGSVASSWTSASPSPGTVDARLPGDANGDGVFSQEDLVQVSQAGKYMTGDAATFAEGDWNGDGVFDQLDLVTALQRGAIQMAGQAARSAATDGSGPDRSLESLDEVFTRIGRQ